MLKNSNLYFAESFSNSGITFFTAASNGFTSVNCEPMCICSPRRCRFFSFEARAEYVKRTGKKNFVIVDAAMNDLIRPAFYDSYHEIVPLQKKSGGTVPSDVVGPICESGDFFCKDRTLPKVGTGDHIALLSAGAYGSVMGSNYNTRALPAEVLVHGNKSALVRERQELEDIWRLERTPAWLAK